jgi:hypothetical protein
MIIILHFDSNDDWSRENENENPIPLSDWFTKPSSISSSELRNVRFVIGFSEFETIDGINFVSGVARIGFWNIVTFVRPSIIWTIFGVGPFSKLVARVVAKISTRSTKMRDIILCHHEIRYFFFCLILRVHNKSQYNSKFTKESF